MAIISIFSNLTDKELDNMHKLLTDKYGNIIKEVLENQNYSMDEKKKMFYKNIKNNNITFMQEINTISEFVKEYIYRTLKDLAFMIYLAMEKNDNYGVYGKERVIISFFRTILNIPCNREVTNFDLDRFNYILKIFEKENGDKTAEEYIELINNYYIEILGEKYTKDTYNEINNLAELLGSDYYLYSYISQIFNGGFIFGIWKKEKMFDYEYFVMQREYIRSPQEVLSVVAQIHRESMFYREESIENIYFIKWQNYFNQSKIEKKKALKHINSSIRDSFKTKTIALYNAKNTTDMLKIKDIFITDMKDNIIYHEMGHLISYNDMSPINLAFKTNLVSDGSVGHVILEALADWAPERDQKKGSFSRFIEISKDDRIRATRFIYTYMSDNWFLNEDEENYMVLMSNILVSLAIYFINNDGSVNFERIINEKDRIYQVFIEWYNIIVDKMITSIMNSMFDIGERKLDYIGLEKKLFEELKERKKINTLEEMREFSSFWLEVYIYLRDFSKNGWEQYKKILSIEANKLEMMVLGIISKGNDAKYKYSLKEYIIERSLEIGILKENQKIEYEKIIKRMCNQLKLSEENNEIILNKFKEILNGKKYNSSINYEGEKDMFIMVLQEMLIESGYGEIKSGMLYGVLYIYNNRYDDNKDFIKSELETLVEKLEEKMFLEINILKINRIYPVQQIIEKLLDEITLSNGIKLKEKIKSVEYIDFDNTALFEIFIPLKRGYMDWNTIQAVWRINDDIRPGDFFSEWTIDRDFLEALFERFSE